MTSRHSTPISFPARANGRDRGRAIRVIDLATQQSPIRTPEHIADEAMRIVDRRATRSPRSRLQRLDDRMEASVLVEVVVWGSLFTACVVAIVVTLIAVRLGWLS